jgi:hypothetical protein
LRRQIKRQEVEKDFDGALEEALKVAKGADSDYLPGLVWPPTIDRLAEFYCGGTSAKFDCYPLGAASILHNCAAISRNIRQQFGYGVARCGAYCLLRNGRKHLAFTNTAARHIDPVF